MSSHQSGGQFAGVVMVKGNQRRAAPKCSDLPAVRGEPFSMVRRERPMMPESNCVTLGPTVLGDNPVKIPYDALGAAMENAAQWRGGASAIISRQLRICLEHGLIGVSGQMLGLVGQLAGWADSPDHLLVRGEPGVPFDCIGRCVLALRSDRQPQRASFQHIPDTQHGNLECGNTLLVYDIETVSHGDQRAIMDRIRRGVRVIGFTHQSVDDLDEILLPTLATHLSVAGLLEVPPLCMRPEDLPLLCYYHLMQHNNRTKYGVHGITAASLYKASGDRWEKNDIALRSQLRSAWENPHDGWAHLWERTEDSEPFSAGESAFQAVPDLPGTTDGDLPVVVMADLPSYDLMGLLEAVDARAAPEQRGRWALDYRTKYLEAEKRGANAAVVAAGDDTPTSAEHKTEGEDEDTSTENQFRRTSAGWAITYDGVPVVVATRKKGMRAIGYLLSKGVPQGGASEVAAIMDGDRSMAGQDNDNEIPERSGQQTSPEQRAILRLREETGHGVGHDGVQKQLTPEQVDHLKKEVQIDLEDIEAELELEETTRERREELSETKTKVKRYYAALVDKDGNSRESGSTDAKRVGRAISRALVSITDQAARSTDPRETSGLEALHKHLEDHIVRPHGDDIRYNGSLWVVQI